MEKFKALKNKWLSPFFRLGLKEDIYYFLESLSALLKAGMDIYSALSILNKESHSFRMRKIIAFIYHRVEDGYPLSGSIEEIKILPPHLSSFIRLGEESGKLEDNLRVLILQHQKDKAFKSKTQSALLYAVVVLSLTFVVAIGTAWFTLPRIAGIYSQMGADLPFLTRALIALGEFLAKYGYIFVPGLVFALGASLYFLFSFPKTKFIGHTILLKMPLIKNLIKQVEVARFGYLLGTMLDAGLPISRCLEAMPNTSTFKNYRKFYTHLYEKVKSGETFEESMNSYPKVNKIFPLAPRQLLIAGEKSGTLSESLLRIGEMYEEKTERTARNLPIVLEPTLLIIVGVMVALFVLATIMPIYNLVGSY